MKKLIVALMLGLLSCLAFALPKPSQIESALAQGHYAEARGMVNEVLREKPDSARAHLLNAYLLAHVDHNKQAAHSELQTALGDDTNGDVRTSALFGRVVAEIHVNEVAPALEQSFGFDDAWPYGLLLIVLVVGVAFWLRARPKAAPTPGRTFREFCQEGGRQPTFGSTGFSAGSGGYSSPAMQPVAPASQPMGAFGTAASVAGGVVAGNAISDMLRHHSRDDDEDERRRRRARDDSYSSSYSDPVPSSSYSDTSSYSSSSSSSDSWSSSDSSSSYDSGSSSSSDW